MPHTYGVSYFSSKGPTGDGRMKPDLDGVGLCRMFKPIDTWSGIIDGQTAPSPYPASFGGPSPKTIL